MTNVKWFASFGRIQMSWPFPRRCFGRISIEGTIPSYRDLFHRDDPRKGDVSSELPHHLRMMSKKNCNLHLIDRINQSFAILLPSRHHRTVSHFCPYSRILHLHGIVLVSIRIDSYRDGLILSFSDNFIFIKMEISQLS